MDTDATKLFVANGYTSAIEDSSVSLYYSFNGSRAADQTLEALDTDVDDDTTLDEAEVEPQINTAIKQNLIKSPLRCLPKNVLHNFKAFSSTPTRQDSDQEAESLVAKASFTADPNNTAQYLQNKKSAEKIINDIKSLIKHSVKKVGSDSENKENQNEDCIISPIKSMNKTRKSLNLSDNEFKGNEKVEKIVTDKNKSANRKSLLPLKVASNLISDPSAVTVEKTKFVRRSLYPKPKSGSQNEKKVAEETEAKKMLAASKVKTVAPQKRKTLICPPKIKPIIPTIKSSAAEIATTSKSVEPPVEQFKSETKITDAKKVQTGASAKQIMKLPGQRMTLAASKRISLSRQSLTSDSSGKGTSKAVRKTVAVKTTLNSSVIMTVKTQITRRTILATKAEKPVEPPKRSRLTLYNRPTLSTLRRSRSPIATCSTATSGHSSRQSEISVRSTETKVKKIINDEFTCSICHKNFRQASALATHQKTHSINTTTTKNKCKYCDKEFAIVKALDNHLQFHCLKIPTGDRRKLGNKLSPTNNAVPLPTKHETSTKSLLGSSISSNESVSGQKDKSVNSTCMPPPSTKVRSKIPHSGISRTPTKVISCHVCQMKFLSVVQFSQHMVSHSPLKDVAQDEI